MTHNPDIDTSGMQQSGAHDAPTWWSSRTAHARRLVAVSAVALCALQALPTPAAAATYTWKNVTNATEWTWYTTHPTSYSYKTAKASTPNCGVCMVNIETRFGRAEALTDVTVYSPNHPSSSSSWMSCRWWSNFTNGPGVNLVCTRTT